MAVVIQSLLAKYNNILFVFTESTIDNVVFVTGRNEEKFVTEESVAEEKNVNKGKVRKELNIPKLNCNDVKYCNNTIKSVCGGKIEHKRWKYRLFLNECFFRKVNCAFKQEINSKYFLIIVFYCITTFDSIST